MSNAIDNKRYRCCVYSPDQRHRYTLWREFGELGALKPGCYAMFIGLNPSTATDELDDATIRRCKRFTQDWGFSAYLMTNLFAYRATDPADMKAASDPVGRDNDFWISELAPDAGIIIAAWGTHGTFRGRNIEVFKLLAPHADKVYCLSVTRNGDPGHPLYLKASAKPQRLLFKSLLATR